jgi:hypothetical protein
MVPADLLRLQMIDLILAHNGRLYAAIPGHKTNGRRHRR